MPRVMLRVLMLIPVNPGETNSAVRCVTPVDKNPESYVREVEEEITASDERGNDGADTSEGSLGIGSLKRR